MDAPAPPLPLPPPPPLHARRRRWLEMLVLFGALPAVISLGPRWTVLAAILGSGAICLVWLLRDPTFGRHGLAGIAGARRGLPAMLGRAAAVAAALLALGGLTRGVDSLFLLPRTRPLLWLVLSLLYPLVSVYPQEIVFRTFFFHRYGGLFRSRAALVVVNAALFGWAHVIVHNRLAILLTAVGGLLLASTYLRARSTVLAVAEHGLYGVLVLTIGLGGMFVNGVRILSKVIK